MSKLPIVSAKKLEQVLFRLGFVAVRQKGSHVFYRHPDGRTTTIPHHSNRDVALPLLRKILRDIDVEPELFQELLKAL